MKITIYTTSECQFSKQEKEYLTSHNLPFEEKNLETNREFLTEMLSVSNNFAGTPVTKIEKDDGSVVVLKGFTSNEFDQTLGMGAAVAAMSATPPATTNDPVPAQTAAPTPVQETPEVPPPAPVEPVHEETPVSPVVEPPAPAVPEPAPTVPAPEPPMTSTAQPAPTDPVMEMPKLDLSMPAAPVAPAAEPSAAPLAPSMPPAPATPSVPSDPVQDEALNSILSSLQQKANTTGNTT
jgi:glutaredoxin